MPPIPPPPPPPSTLPSSTPASAESLITRSQKFIEEHKLLCLGAAVLAASGAGYYLYTSSAASASSSSRSVKKPKSGGEEEKLISSSDEDVVVAGASKKKKKSSSSKKSKKKNAAANSANGPLLEERTPEEVAKILEKTAEKEKAAAGADEGSAGPSKKEVTGPAWMDGIPVGEELAKASPAERKVFAQTLKTRGNKLYSNKNYEDAIGCYTKALEVASKPEAVFYSNRAACYQNLTPPLYSKVIEDCDSALKLDSTYVKALNRRATALEALGREDEALRDFTATSILEKFGNDAATASVDRVLKKLASKRGAEMMAAREPRLPATTFVASYLGAFRPRAKPAFPELPAGSPNTGNNTLSLAFDALAAADYPKAFILCQESLLQGLSDGWKEGEAEALNMRGTFKFLLGDSVGAKEDFEKSLDIMPNYVQSLVKVASVHMELGDAAGAFGDFEAAIRHNPDDPDIYYHRGQLYFVTNEYEKASADYLKSTDLDPHFVFSHVQLAVAQYKLGNIKDSMVSFRKTLKAFPTNYEPLNYYGELLLDQQRFEDAIEKFDSAIAIVKTQHPSNVLPFVNKALGLFQWKQDARSAEALCKEALAIDEDCDVAIATLAQLSLQQGRIPEAIKWFEKSAKLARTEPELTGAITYQLASQAQLAFLQNYPEQGAALGQLAQQL